MVVETYDSINIISQALTKLKKKIRVREGYIPLNMSVGLAMDLKKQGLTK